MRFRSYHFLGCGKVGLVPSSVQTASQQLSEFLEAVDIFWWFFQRDLESLPTLEG